VASHPEKGAARSAPPGGENSGEAAWRRTHRDIGPRLIFLFGRDSVCLVAYSICKVGEGVPGWLCGQRGTAETAWATHG